MNTLTVFAVVAVFSVGVFGDGHGEHSSDKMHPRLKVHTHFENDVFKFHASIEQSFPDRGEASHPESLVTLMKAESALAALTNVRLYAIWDEISNCSAYNPETAKYFHELTQDIQMENMSSPSSNMSQAADAMAAEATPEHDEPFIFPVMYSTIFLQVNGINYCLQPEVEEMNMKKIKLMFPKCANFTQLALRETIEERFGIDKKRVFVGRFGYDEDCHFADVYFQYAFEDGMMIHKIWESLTSKSGFGRFSANDKCMTNVRDSFFTDVALGMCYTHMMMEQQNTEPKELSTCMGVSEKVAKKYEERIRQYDCLVAEYAKKYGIKADGCSKKQSSSASDKQACTCASGPEAELQNFMRVLLGYINAPLYYEELYAKKEELSKMLAGQNFDHTKFEKLAAEIKSLETEQAEYYMKTFFGFCIVSGHGAGAMAKLEYVKGRVSAGDGVDDILRALMDEAIRYYLDLRINMFMNHNMTSEKKDTLKMKAQLLLGVSKTCSTVDERTRVWNTIMKVVKSFDEHVETFNKMVDNEMVANVTRMIAHMVKENPDMIVQKLFLVLFSPMEISDDDEAVKAVMRFFEVMEENKMHIASKIKSHLGDLSVMDLMDLQIMLMTPEDTRKECDLSGLVEMVQPPAEETQAGGDYGEGNYDSDYHYDDYQMPRGRGSYGRRQGGSMRDGRSMYNGRGGYHGGYDYHGGRSGYNYNGGHDGYGYNGGHDGYGYNGGHGGY